MNSKFYYIPMVLAFLFCLSCSDDSSSSDDDEITGTVIDIDGNVYNTVKIGNQWWMAENLEVIHYQNGDIIPNVINNSEWADLSAGAYCAYDNNNDNVEAYGLLYNWFAVNDNRNLAPGGWHVPSDLDWKVLEMHLGMSQNEVDSLGYRGTDEGGKLKEEDAAFWDIPSIGATNETGFSARPGGYRGIFGSFYEKGSEACFWSATESGNIFAWYRQLQHYDSEIYYNGEFKYYGLSIRCVKD